MKLELGGAPQAADSAKSEPKQAASKDQPTASEPEPKDDVGAQDRTSRPSAPPKEPAENAQNRAASRTSDSVGNRGAEGQGISMPVLGSREERRVCDFHLLRALHADMLVGQDESDASSNRGTFKAISEYRRVANNLQRGRYVFPHGISEALQR